MWTISYSDYCVLSAFQSDPDQYSNYQWNGKQEERQVIEQINSILDTLDLRCLWESQQHCLVGSWVFGVSKA